MGRQQSKKAAAELARTKLYDYVKQQFDLADADKAALASSEEFDDDYLGYSDQDRPDDDIRDFIHRR